MTGSRCGGLAILSWWIGDVSRLWRWQVGIRHSWWHKNTPMCTATNSVNSACKIGTSCVCAVSSAVSKLHVLPSVRLTLCWCSHFSCWWYGAWTSTIIIILNNLQRQHHARNLKLTFWVNFMKQKHFLSRGLRSARVFLRNCTQSATLINIDWVEKDEYGERTSAVVQK